MPSIVLKIVPNLLENPDLDIRYALPDIIRKRSTGLVQDDGYDYSHDQQALLLFLTTEQVDKAVSCIVQVVEQVVVLGNDLRPAVIVAVEQEDGYEVVYPLDYQAEFSI